MSHDIRSLLYHSLESAARPTTKDAQLKTGRHFANSHGRWGGNLRVTVAALWACLSLAAAASAQLPGVTDNVWTGVSSNWSDVQNWSLGAVPGPTDAVRFDQNSLANLTINNDLSGVSISGLVNTSAGANNGPTGPVTIQGNPITIGATGIVNGSGNPMDPYGYTGPAQANITVDVDLTLSADQRWKMGGPGTATNAQPAGQQSIIVGASPNSHTVSLNGFRPTLTVISNPLDMIIVNSKLVDGATPSSLGISKLTGTSTSFQFDAGNINNNPRVRITGDNTYSGGTDIVGGRQLIQLGSSTIKNQAGNIISGPLGTGPITQTDTGSAQGPHLVAWGADRTLDNPITLNGTLSFSSTQDDTRHILTLGGDITVPGNAALIMGNEIGASNNQRNGSGDVIVNGKILLNGFNGNLTLGQSATPTAGVVVGKLIINGSILANGSYTLNVTGGGTAVPTVVQLNGQNTYTTTNLTAAGAASAAMDANIQIGSSSIVDALGNIISGPLGLGLLTVNNAGNTPRIEAVHGPQTVANIIALGGTSSIIFQGDEDLTLTGPISSGGGGLTKSGTARLILSGASDYSGATTVNGGTLLVNGSIAGSGVTVNSAGTLGGAGSIASAVTSDGAIAPGDGIGTLTLNNSLTLNDASSLAFELGAAGSHDRIDVASDLTLPATGAVTLNLTNAGGMGEGTFTLIDYAGTLNGDFSTLMLGAQPAGFTYSLIHNTLNTSIDLQVLAAAGLAGDYNNDGKVDAADYVLWRKNPGANGGDPAGYLTWRANFGAMAGAGGAATAASAVPEPASLLLAAAALLWANVAWRRSPAGRC